LEGALGQEGREEARVVGMSFHLERRPNGKVLVSSAIDDGNGEVTKLTAAELSTIIVSLIQLYGHCAGISYHEAAIEVIGSGSPDGCVGFASAPD